jgi:hypothetical protein
MRRSPVLIPVSVLALLALLAAGIWVLAQEPPSPSLRLPGGAVLRLKGMEYGKRYAFTERKLWQQLFGPILPPSLQGREIIRGSSPREALTLWFQPENDRRPWGISHRLEAVDEHGCRFEGGYEMGLAPEAGTPLRSGRLLLFPRRSSSFRLRLYESDADDSAAELTLANPVPGPYPTWHPEPLPAARRVEHLEVRLLSLSAGLARADLLRAPSPAVQDDADTPLPPAWRVKSWARAAFRLTEDGRPTDRWRLSRVTVSDATGNSASYPDTEECSFVLPSLAGVGFVASRPSRGTIRSKVDGQGRLWMAFPSLCVREAAWKLLGTLSYVGPPEGRQPDLSWTVPRVPAPRPFHQTGAIALRSWPGVTLKLLKVSGRGAWGAEALADPAASARVFVRATADGGFTLRVAGTDERRRPIACSHYGSSDMGAYDRWWFDLRIPAGAHRLTLRFSGWKGRSVQFLARPRLALLPPAAS